MIHCQTQGFLSEKMERLVAHALIQSFPFCGSSWRSEAIERTEMIASNLKTPARCLDLMILARKIHMGRPKAIPKAIDDSLDFPVKSKRLNAVRAEVCLFIPICIYKPVRTFAGHSRFYGKSSH